MPSLWTRSYFVSTAGNVCSETIKKYVENQKNKLELHNKEVERLTGNKNLSSIAI
jgi:hypothetical protein